MEKCRRMKRPQCTSKNWNIYLDNESPRGYASSFHRSESFAMNTDTLTIGSTDKKHISSTTVFWYSAIRRSSFRSWFQACQRVLPPVSLLQHLWHFQGRRLITLHLPQARLVHQPQLSLSDSETRAREDLSGIDFSSSICVKPKCWRDGRTGRLVVCCQANQKPKTK